LEALLHDGRIDAFLGMSLRDSGLPPKERRLRPLLANAQEEEEAYFARTSVYPIHHCVVMRNDALEREPALAAAVFGAYAAAKDRAYRRRLGTTLAPWSKAHWTSTFERFGGDPLEYGLTPANRLVIERLSAYLRDQGFIATTPAIDAVFAAPSVPA
jgi:4,5-dihydroxyphthalate decarboxylase